LIDDAVGVLVRSLPGNPAVANVHDEGTDGFGSKVKAN
jgi:hypothetical protein